MIRAQKYLDVCYVSWKNIIIIFKKFFKYLTIIRLINMSIDFKHLRTSQPEYKEVKEPSRSRLSQEWPLVFHASQYPSPWVGVSRTDSGPGYVIYKATIETLTQA